MANSLHGKKILFIGNSYTFYGNTVIHKGYTVLTRERRDNDPGYFYQLCKLGGMYPSPTGPSAATISPISLQRVAAMPTVTATDTATRTIWRTASSISSVCSLGLSRNLRATS